jgi:hypothetical protein
MYLWLDPENPTRALLWRSTPTSSVDPATANLVITDIGRAREGVFTEIATGNWNQLFPGAADPAAYDNDLALHSMTPSADGKRTYLAYLRGGFGVLDTRKVAKDKIPPGTVESLNDDLLTAVPFPTWGTGPRCEGDTPAGCAESHSALPLPGRPFAHHHRRGLRDLHGAVVGWPWGWMRTWKVAEPRRPRLLAEYKILQNTTAYTPAPGENEFTSYSSHNPTPTRNLVLDGCTPVACRRPTWPARGARGRPVGSHRHRWRPSPTRTQRCPRGRTRW